MSPGAGRRAGLALLAALVLALLAGCEADPEPSDAERDATAGGEREESPGASTPAPTGDPDAARDPADAGDAGAGDAGAGDADGEPADGEAGEPAPARYEPGVPLQARSAPLAVWTGEEVLVVGGVDIRDERRRDGAAYRPGRGWRALALAPRPLSGAYAAAWTGQALLVVEPSAPAVLRYDPDLDAWQEREAGEPARRLGAVAGWSGTELLLAGGTHADDEAAEGSAALDDAWAYDPATDRWRELDPLPSGPRPGAVGGWTDAGLVVAGGRDEAFEPVGDTARYDPDERAWEVLDDVPDTASLGGEAVWTGDELVAVGGAGGAALDPAAGAWRALAERGEPAAAGEQLAWTGEEVLVVGGLSLTVDEEGLRPRARESVAAYDPDADAWSSWPTAPLEARQGAAVAWTDEGLLVWGGDDGRFDDLTRYDDGGLLDGPEGDWRRLEP
ncbi:MAG: kelch repeat-containing protein [Egibacteraceae bacterium]